MQERWQSPFPYTLSYNLFRKHITELNKMYWAFVPASNTIKKAAKTALVTDDADPKTYFLIPDKDDRRVAPTFSEWKTDFRSFENYTRLNMVMLISSCFETYLRTVVSHAFESKPGVIIMCPDSVDGTFLLKSKTGYGNGDSKNYQFADQIEEICRGEWAKRMAAFEKYFGALSQSIVDQTAQLDELRVTRNNIGHYLGRKKSEYAAPLLFSPLTPTAVGHDRVLKYFKLVNDVAKGIDAHLKNNVIGSYDIIKFYFQQVSDGKFDNRHPGQRAREFQQCLGREGLPPVGSEFYRNIVSFFDLDDATDVCRYSAKACIIEINRRLEDKNISLARDGRNIRFSKYHFRLFIKAYKWKTNPEFCKVNTKNEDQIEYCYSMRLIEKIVEEVCQNSATIIECLQAMVTN